MITESTMVHLLSLGFLFNLFSWSYADMFTAITDMEPLLETHERIINDLDYYVKKEEERLGNLKRHLNLYKKEHKKAMEDIPNYLGNPINAFTLIKRLTADLDQIETSINIRTDHIKNITMKSDDVKYPNLEDLTGAAQAFTRLQETYRLNVEELSEGVLNGVTYSTPMSAGDCYELGKVLYNDKDFKNAQAWMMEALRKYKEEKTTYPFNEADILEYIVLLHNLIGDVKSALDWTMKLLVVDPGHSARAKIPHYKKAIAEQEAKLKKQRRGDIGELKQKKPEDVLTSKSEWSYVKKHYEALCRGEIEISREVSKKLKCFYLTANHPFLKYAPIKTEQSYIRPDIFIFHEVISDEEIELVKSMAKPKFKRAVFHDPKTGELIPRKYRICKTGWLRDEEHPIIARISQRVKDMTGLSLLTAEKLQVANYGIGGHYEPHFDFFGLYGLTCMTRKEDGNRIATVLFYMSDVAQGGATVFTELDLSLLPIKGAAAFWLNLHPSGEGNTATRHAGCPVLRGSKWMCIGSTRLDNILIPLSNHQKHLLCELASCGIGVIPGKENDKSHLSAICNKWIRQVGQEFLKPCNLEYQQDARIDQPPRAVPKTSR